MTTTLVDDFMIASLQSQLAIQKATLKTAEDNRQFPGTNVMAKLATSLITEIENQLTPLLAKRDAKV